MVCAHKKLVLADTDRRIAGPVPACLASAGAKNCGTHKWGLILEFYNEAHSHTGNVIIFSSQFRKLVDRLLLNFSRFTVVWSQYLAAGCYHYFQLVFAQLLVCQQRPSLCLPYVRQPGHAPLPHRQELCFAVSVTSCIRHHDGALPQPYPFILPRSPSHQLQLVS